MYRHVLCLYPYRRTVSSKTSFPPLGLEYIAAALAPHAEQVEVVNYRHHRAPSARAFLRPETDLVCYSINWPEDLDAIRADIQALPPGPLAIAGGRTATENPRPWLETCSRLDAVVCGDGEQAIAEIAQGLPWPQVAGLVYRDEQGRLACNAPRANLPLDEALMPARALRQRPYYLTSKGASTGITIDQIAGSRGCPFRCKFCSFAINPWGVKRSWAPRSPASIVREIEQIDAQLVMFVDDVFTHQPDRVAEICDLLVARGIRKRYVVNARSEIALRPDVLRKMEQAGFLALLVGVESAQDATLAAIGKGVTIAQLRERFAVLRTSRMLINAYFIVGNLGETEEQMLEIAPFARSLGVDLIHVSRLRNEPHSGLAELVERTPGYHIDAEGFVYSDAYSSQRLAQLRKRIDRRFYTPWQVAKIGWKIGRQLRFGELTQATFMLPAFLATLGASQLRRKLAKRLRRRPVR